MLPTESAGAGPRPEATEGYVVLAVADLGEVECRCGRCDWRGWASTLRAVKACELTPGDASPIGRCPKCFDLAYANRPEDRAVGFSQQTYDTMCELLRLHEALHEGRAVKIDRLEGAIRSAQLLEKAVRGRNLPRRRKSGKADEVVDGAPSDSKMQESAQEALG